MSPAFANALPADAHPQVWPIVVSWQFQNTEDMSTRERVSREAADVFYAALCVVSDHRIYRVEGETSSIVMAFFDDQKNARRFAQFCKTLEQSSITHIRDRYLLQRAQRLLGGQFR